MYFLTRTVTRSASARSSGDRSGKSKRAVEMSLGELRKEPGTFVLVV